MTRNSAKHNMHRQRGVAAILSMMFLLILGSLAAAMAIVAQGNLTTADSHIRINRALAAAETGMRFLIFRVNQITAEIQTTDGLIDDDNAPGLWLQVRAALLDPTNPLSLVNEAHNLSEPVPDEDTLIVGPISLGTDNPTDNTVFTSMFTATFTPHPIVLENGDPEDYDAPYYQRPPYSDMTPAVSMANPLDTTWVRVRVVATDGPITRSIQMDFKIEKKIRFAVLSQSRVMTGRNVMIDGPIGSRFLETHLEHGHPVQMVSDFRGMAPTLDADLDLLVNTLALNDMNGDNRLNLANSAEVAGISDPQLLDFNSDGYIDDYDFFIDHFDTLPADGEISASELDAADPTSPSYNINNAQLLELIDTFGDPGRYGYGDGVIDDLDRYAKIRGNVMILADLQGWLDGAAGGQYQDFFQGSIHADHDDQPLMFEADQANVQQFVPTDFDVTSFQTMASGSLADQANLQAATNPSNTPGLPLQDLSNTHVEEVPFGSAYPYDYYNRPVYENMTFSNVTLPRGTNALFKNCTFIGATFVETATDNIDPDFNYTGITEADGTLRYPDLTAVVDNTVVADTKTVSNNLRFDGCTFEGAVISEAPQAYTHIRNKMSFTGNTKFEIENSSNLSTDEKKLFKRSTILTPHYSVEMGTFSDAYSSTETVNLSGTIVAGVIDVRGQVKLVGTLLTTFEPVSGVTPVIGDTSPQFNTTLGYFPSSSGDLEAELPANGVGVIQIRYDPTIALPNGILGPIDLTPITATYFEGGA